MRITQTDPRVLRPLRRNIKVVKKNMIFRGRPQFHAALLYLSAILLVTSTRDKAQLYVNRNMIF